MKIHIFFDFDDTLVDTQSLVQIRKNQYGREYITQNPEKVKTSLPFLQLPELFHKLKENHKVSIATNSSEGYARSLLLKHGYSIENIPIYSNLQKPNSNKLSKIIEKQCTDKNEKILLVGDSYIDILTAVKLGIQCIIVGWGNIRDIFGVFPYTPFGFVRNPNELESKINQFCDSYMVRLRTDTVESYYLSNLYYQAADFMLTNPTNVSVESVYDYFPVHHENFNKSNSDEILRFKDIKLFTEDQISNDLRHKFMTKKFTISSTSKYKDVFNHFFSALKHKIDDIGLDGNSFVIACPNSLPDKCYSSDVNHYMATCLNEHLHGNNSFYSQRVIVRLSPKEESHICGNRNIQQHFETLGLTRDHGFLQDYENIIIFDDIATSGSQINAIAAILSNISNFNKNIIGLTIGRTVGDDSEFDIPIPDLSIPLEVFEGRYNDGSQPFLVEENLWSNDHLGLSESSKHLIDNDGLRVGKFRSTGVIVVFDDTIRIPGVENFFGFIHDKNLLRQFEPHSMRLVDFISGKEKSNAISNYLTWKEEYHESYQSYIQSVLKPAEKKIVQNHKEFLGKYGKPYSGINPINTYNYGLIYCCRCKKSIRGDYGIECNACKRLICECGACGCVYEPHQELSGGIDNKELNQSLVQCSQMNPDIEIAKQNFEELSVSSDQNDDHKLVVAAYHQLAVIAEKEGDFSSSEHWYKKALVVKEQLGNEQNVVNTFRELGLVAQERRDYKSAERWYKKALDIFEKRGNEQGAAMIYFQYGSLAEEQRNFSAAKLWYSKALEIFEKHSCKEDMANTYGQLGTISREQGDLRDAKSFYKKALGIFEEYGNEHTSATIYYILGGISQEQGELTVAESLYKKALAVFQKQANEHFSAYTYLHLGMLSQEQSDFTVAVRWYKMALIGFEEQCDHQNTAHTYNLLGMIAFEKGHFTPAEKWFKRALAIFEKQGSDNNIQAVINNLEILKEHISHKM